MYNSHSLRSPLLHDMLAEYASVDGSRPLYHRLRFKGDDDILSFSEFHAHVHRAAQALVQAAPCGARIPLLFPSENMFLIAFFGCLKAGLIPVPLAASGGKTAERLTYVAKDCHAGMVLTTDKIRMTLSDANILSVHTVDEILTAYPDSAPLPIIDACDTAFIQYTSGSTASPKGVIVTHLNLMTNLRQIYNATGMEQGEPIVSWLPQFHDMGLIGTMLMPVYSGSTVHYMAPTEFVQKPERWLQALSRFRGVGTVAPNFGFAYALKRIKDCHLTELDLRSVRHILSGAEPIRADTVRDFLKRFKSCGLREDAFFPCYGMAEATLFVCGGPPRMPDIRRIDTSCLEQGSAHFVAQGGREIVNCGRIAHGMSVRVIDPETRAALAPGQIGEIVIAGDNVSPGYWGREPAQHDNVRFIDSMIPFTRTGDLGFCEGNEIFITGRCKDVIIVRGRNLYPQDIEAVSELQTPGAMVSSAAAVTGYDNDGNEAVIVVQEVRPRDIAFDEADALRMRISQAIAGEFAVHPHAVILTRTNTIARTTSGKISRAHVKKALENGTLYDVYHEDSIQKIPAAV